MRAHRQAWAWQDEWHGLTMEDIRNFERETQLLLQSKFCSKDTDGEDNDDGKRQNLFYLYVVAMLG